MTMIATRTEMETHTGLYFDFANPQPATIDVADIAQALANTCRFGGHIPTFYSVAEHALLVRRLVVDAGHLDLSLAALHHDSHEAYVGDIPTPLKRAIGEPYREMVTMIDRAIADALGLSHRDLSAEPVREADELALRIEASRLKLSRGIEGAWPWRELPADPPNGWSLGRTPEQVVTAFIAAHHAGMA